MDFENLVNTNLSKLSANDLEVCNYISTFSEQINTYTLNQLAKQTFTSRSSILRLLKKLGFSGFTEFKYFFNQQMSPKPTLNNTLLHLFNRLTIQELIKNAQDLNELIRQASDIFLFSTGKDQSIQAENFSNYLLKRGIITTSIPLNLNSDLTQTVLNHMNKKSLVILFSCKGDNDILKTYFNQNLTIVSFTTFSKGWIQSISTINFSLDYLNKSEVDYIYSSGLMHLLLNIVAEAIEKDNH